jgi:hypothetical protein
MIDARDDKFMHFVLKTLKGRNHLEDLESDGRTILKQFIKQTVIFSVGSGQGSVSGSCPHSNEP